MKYEARRFILFRNLTGITRDLLHYFDTRKHRLNIAFQYYHQEQSSSDALKTPNKCTEMGAKCNPGTFADSDS